jgi:hypothetical protein
MEESCLLCIVTSRALTIYSMCPFQNIFDVILVDVLSAGLIKSFFGKE